jgi:peptide subunit release factor 1 (eRF1)
MAVTTHVELGADAVARTLEQLMALENHDRRVLTVLLDLDTSHAAGRHRTVQLHDVMSPLKKKIDPGSVEGHWLTQAEQEVTNMLHHAPPGARSLASFVCEPDGICIVVPLPMATPASAHWNKRAWLGPLRDLANPRFWSLIMVSDTRSARLFLAGFDSITELVHLRDDTPAKHEKGAEAQSNIARWHDEEVRRHARRVVRALEAELSALRVGNICIAAPAEMAAALRAQLPARLSHAAVDYFRVPANASAATILERARPIIEWHDARYERDLVNEVLQAVGEQRGALGLAPVVSAVAAAQAELVIATSPLEAAGAACNRCELMMTMPTPAECPVCGGAMLEEPDFIEYLADRVVRQGGRFERVHDAAAEPLVAGGGIGARLRYTNSAKPLQEG